MRCQFLHSLILFVSLLPILVSSALVQTYSCADGNRPLREDNGKVGSWQIKDSMAEVIIKDGLIYYRVEFQTASEVNDVNYTTNLYSTLHVSSRFLNGEVLTKSVRLCDYVSPVMNYTNSSSSSSGQLSDIMNSPLNESMPNSSDGGAFLPWKSGPGVPRFISKREDLNNDEDSSNNTCPLIPGNRYQLIFASNTSTARYFGSYETMFTFYSADLEKNNEIGCLQVYATPYHPEYITYPICFGVMAIFALGIISNFYIFHASPHQESTNVFLVIASSICNEPLLNEMTPDLTMMLNYLQFMLFAFALDLNYPGFAQPIISYLNWVALIRVDIFSSCFIGTLSEGGVYKTFGRKGLYGIFPVNNAKPDGETSSNMWKDFIIWIWCVIFFFIILTQLFALYKQHVTKNYKISGLRSRVYFAIGTITQIFYCIFPLPFVTFSCFLILGLAQNLNVEIGACVVCILFFFIWLLSIFWFSFKYVIRRKEKLYSSFKVITCWSSLYHYYKPKCSYFLIVEGFLVLFQGIVIGCGQSSGAVQVALLVFIEIVHIMLVLFIQPYFNKTKNIWTLVISGVSLVMLFLNISYIRELDVPIKIRGIIGDIQLMISAILIMAFLIFFIARFLQVLGSNLRLKKIDTYVQQPKNEQDEKQSISADDEFEKDEPEFDFEANHDPRRFPRPRVVHQISDTASIHTAESSIIELTDHRALPGLSLGYLSSQEHLPAPVSPIDDTYLANLSNNDSELGKLWAKRNHLKGFNKAETSSTFGDATSSFLQRIKSASDTTEKGFSVVGRKDIVVDKGKSKGTKTGFEVVGRKPIAVQDNGTVSQGNKKFVVVGRKPIIVNLDAKLNSEENLEEKLEE